MTAAIAFAIFGALLVRHVNADPEAALGGAVVAAITGSLATLVLRWLLAASAGDARGQHGFRAVSLAARDGMTLLLPFALLAAFTELVLGWQAVQAFVAAGLMGGAAAAATATIRLGAPALRATLLAGLWSLAMAGGAQWAVPALRLGGQP